MGGIEQIVEPAFEKALCLVFNRHIDRFRRRHVDIANDVILEREVGKITEDEIDHGLAILREVLLEVG